MMLTQTNREMSMSTCGLNHSVCSASIGFSGQANEMIFAFTVSAVIGGEQGVLAGQQTNNADLSAEPIFGLVVRLPVWPTNLNPFPSTVNHNLFMKTLSPIFYLLSSIICLAQPQQAWVQRYNGGFTNKTNAPLAMKLDAAGNIYVAGSSQNSSNFYDYVVLKYGPNGTLQWAARYSPTNGGTYPANGFALDQNGNTYMTGGVILGQYPNTYVIGNGGTVKFDTNGMLAWAAPYPGDDVAVDTNGNVYVTGFSTTQFATAKLDSTGSNVWTRTYVWVTSPGNPVAVSQKVAVDNAGNVYVAGWADYHSYYMNGQWNYYTLPTMLMYDPTGNLVWINAPFNSYNLGDNGWTYS